MLLTLPQFSLLCVLIGISLTINSYFKPHKIIKQQESKLSNSKKVELYINRFFHYIGYPIVRLFIFMEADFNYDLLFLIYSFFMILHWTIYGECFMTIREKTILDPSYKPGTSCYYEPFIELIGGNDSFIHYFIYINILFVLYLVYSTKRK